MKGSLKDERGMALVPSRMWQRWKGGLPKCPLQSASDAEVSKAGRRLRCATHGKRNQYKVRAGGIRTKAIFLVVPWNILRIQLL
jgi:hypothetical protein